MSSLSSPTSDSRIINGHPRNDKNQPKKQVALLAVGAQHPWKTLGNLVNTDISETARGEHV